MAWADSLYELDLVSKTIVWRLSWHANEDGDTWCKVETLAGYCNCSERTVQSRLSMLKEKGYLKDTGRTHRLNRSTRCVPLYVLAPHFEPVDNGDSMGENSAPIGEAWVKVSRGMGATVCTPKETQETTEVSSETSPRAREGFADLYSRIEAAYPAKGLGWTDPAVARRALADLVGQGVDGESIVAAAARYAADPVLKRRDYGPVSLQRWLGEGRYRAWLAPEPGGEAEAAGAAAGPVFAGPAGLRSAILGQLGEGFAGTLDRCGWDASAGVLSAPTSWAHGKLSTVSEIIAGHGATLASPVGVSA